MIARSPEATITGPRRSIFRWHASYTTGMFFVERGDVALTRKGIERKARRMLTRLQRDEDMDARAARIS